MRFNFLKNCYYYSLQKCLIQMILLMKTTNNTTKNGHLFQITTYRILIIGSFTSVKINALLNLIQDDIDKICLYAKDLSEPKYEFLINKRKDVRIKYCNDPNGFLKCSNTMDDVYENIDDYNPSRKRKTLIVFDDMIADVMTRKKFQPIIKELFIRCRKLNTSLVFITKSYFSVSEDFRLNSTHYLIMKINNKE